MSRTRDVKARIIDNPEFDRLLRWEDGQDWVFQHPVTKRKTRIAQYAANRELKNLEARVRRFLRQNDEVAALQDAHRAERAADPDEHAGWRMVPAELLDAAHAQGVHVAVHDGQLVVTCPADASGLAQVIRRREAEVTNYLLHTQPKENTTMPSIGETARVTRRDGTQQTVKVTMTPKGSTPAAEDPDEKVWAMLQRVGVRIEAAEGRATAVEKQLAEAQEYIAELEKDNAGLRQELADAQARLQRYRDTFSGLLGGDTQ